MMGAVGEREATSDGTIGVVAVPIAGTTVGEDATPGAVGTMVGVSPGVLQARMAIIKMITGGISRLTLNICPPSHRDASI
jgi:hypothetical protein